MEKFETAENTEVENTDTEQLENGDGDGVCLGEYYFRTDPHDPTFYSKGEDPNNPGKYYIKVKGPNSYVENDRVYCAVTIQPLGGSETAMSPTGSTGAPFRNNTLTVTNLDATSYDFRAKADYNDYSHVEGPGALTVTVP